MGRVPEVQLKALVGRAGTFRGCCAGNPKGWMAEDQPNWFKPEAQGRFMKVGEKIMNRESIVSEFFKRTNKFCIILFILLLHLT